MMEASLQQLSSQVLLLKLSCTGLINVLSLFFAHVRELQNIAIKSCRVVDDVRMDCMLYGLHINWSYCSITVSIWSPIFIEPSL